ncbi:MAG TPA: hypothetical protein PK299_15920, partial [Anaerolineales bacterium]|nr:hypothetical protein [Anaerolineales bacterium]
MATVSLAGTAVGAVQAVASTSAALIQKNPVRFILLSPSNFQTYNLSATSHQPLATFQYIGERFGTEDT